MYDYEKAHAEQSNACEDKNNTDMLKLRLPPRQRSFHYTDAVVSFQAKQTKMDIARRLHIAQRSSLCSGAPTAWREGEAMASTVTGTTVLRG